MKTSLKRTATLSLLVMGLLLSLPKGARAQDTNALEIIKRLEKRIEQLEQKVKSLEFTAVNLHFMTKAKFFNMSDFILKCLSGWRDLI